MQLLKKIAKKMLFLSLIAFALFLIIKLTDKLDYVPEALFIAVLIISADIARKK